MAPATLLNATCVSLLSSNLARNISGSFLIPLDFHECELPPPHLDKFYWKRWIIGAVVFTFIVMLVLVCVFYSTAQTSILYRLRVLDSYNLHREVEALWAKNQVHGKDALIKYHRGPDSMLPYRECPRYSSVNYRTDIEKGKRTIIITEDLSRGPSEKERKTWKRDLVSKTKALQLQPGNGRGHDAGQQEALDELNRAPTARAAGNDVEMENLVRAPEPATTRMPGEWRESLSQ